MNNLSLGKLPDVMTVKDFASWLGVSSGRVKTWVTNGDLPVIRGLIRSCESLVNCRELRRILDPALTDPNLAAHINRAVSKRTQFSVSKPSINEIDSMNNSKSINELLFEVNTTLRDSNPDLMLSGDVHALMCNFADAMCKQQELIDSLLNRLNESGTVTRQENHVGTMHCRRYYRNGAHAGNVYYRVEGWGMANHSVEDEVIRLVGKFITGLNFKRNFSCGPVEISCAHPLTAEQIAEWAHLKEKS